MNKHIFLFLLLLLSMLISQIYITGTDSVLPEHINIEVVGGAINKVAIDGGFYTYIGINHGGPIVALHKQSSYKTLFSFAPDYEGVDQENIEMISFSKNINYSPTGWKWSELVIDENQDVDVKIISDGKIKGVVSLKKEGSKYSILSIIKKEESTLIPIDFLKSAEKLSSSRTINVINNVASLVSDISLKAFDDYGDRSWLIQDIKGNSKKIIIEDYEYKDLRICFTYNNIEHKTDPIPLNTDEIIIDDALLQRKAKRSLFTIHVASKDQYRSLHFLFEDIPNEKQIINNSVEIQSAYKDIRHAYLQNENDKKLAVYIREDGIYEVEELKLVVVDFNSTFGSNKKGFPEFRKSLIKTLYNKSYNNNIILYKYLNILPAVLTDFNRYNINEIFYKHNNIVKTLKRSNYDELRNWLLQDGAISEDEIRARLFSFEPVRIIDTLSIENTMSTIEDMVSSQYRNIFNENLELNEIADKYINTFKTVYYISYNPSSVEHVELDKYGITYYSFTNDIEMINTIFNH
ncbi:MAG: hypothetical protein HQ510_13145 [Candidatus Marinimicrobia bacterium]|nr:hypothetical protein [Candidatus Neomarinimicrobiota bacterium]